VLLRLFPNQNWRCLFSLPLSPNQFRSQSFRFRFRFHIFGRVPHKQFRNCSVLLRLFPNQNRRCLFSLPLSPNQFRSQSFRFRFRFHIFGRVPHKQFRNCSVLPRLFPNQNRRCLFSLPLPQITSVPQTRFRHWEFPPFIPRNKDDLFCTNLEVFPTFDSVCARPVPL
jgi:hypothetical protein